MATTKPQDHKPKRHPKSEKFVFTTDDGDVLSATYVENLPYAFVEELGGLDDKEVQKRFIDEILSDEDKELFKTLTIGEVVDFFREWQDKSALSLGEL